MKRIAILITCFIIVVAGIITSCNKDSVNPNLPVLKLHPVNVTGKSGKHVFDTLDIVAPLGVGKLVLSKTINLVPDDAFGMQSVTPVSTGSNT